MFLINLRYIFSRVARGLTPTLRSIYFRVQCVSPWSLVSQANHMSIKIRVVGSLALLLGAKLITIQVWYVDLAPVTLSHAIRGVNAVESTDHKTIRLF